MARNEERETTMNPSQIDPAVTSFCNACMKAFSVASCSAATDSDLARAKATLGVDAYCAAASEGMRAAVKGVFANAGEHVAAFDAGLGSLATQAIIAGVVADTCRHIVEAAAR